MNEERLLILHRRSIVLLKIIIDREKQNANHHYFMNNTIDISLDDIEHVNTQLDLNNDVIDKTWKLYRETMKEINKY